MGQTQILFIVLAVIIVGIAVAVGITQFQSSAVEANRNAVTADLQNMVAQAQLWYKKPKSMGGGEQTLDGLVADEASMRKLGCVTGNANGTYTIDAIDAGNKMIRFRGVGTEDGDDNNVPLAITISYWFAKDSTFVNQVEY